MHLNTNERDKEKDGKKEKIIHVLDRTKYKTILTEKLNNKKN